MLLLGIETSCDETAAAVVADGRVVLSNIVASQSDIHARYGGVFPEEASRQHVRDIAPVVRQALQTAGVSFEELGSLAVTRGPGLAGSLLVGVNFGKGLALATGLPLAGVNHMAGHLASNWLHVGGELRATADHADDPQLPHLTLIASGGHTELVLVRERGRFEVLGTTCDDAAGEAFDKAARLLGLPYPGGPALEAAARSGDPAAFDFPVARTAAPLDFSFSGLKSALRRAVESFAPGPAPVADLAAAFQAAVVRALVQGLGRALEAYDVAEVHLAGGVSANAALRAAVAERAELPLRVPPPALCTDNAAMIASAAYLAPSSDSPAQGNGGHPRFGLGIDVAAGGGLAWRTAPSRAERAGPS
jgi:N6-L-threonylcarbamoyladenine synthase